MKSRKHLTALRVRHHEVAIAIWSVVPLVDGDARNWATVHALKAQACGAAEGVSALLEFDEGAQAAQRLLLEVQIAGGHIAVEGTSIFIVACLGDLSHDLVSRIGIAGPDLGRLMSEDGVTTNLGVQGVV